MKKKSAVGGGVKARIVLIIAAILVIILLATAASFSWFYEGTRGTVQTIWTNVVEIDKFLIRTGDQVSWAGSVHLADAGVVLKPVCGNALANTFFVPSFKLDMEHPTEVTNPLDSKENLKLYKNVVDTITQLNATQLADRVFMAHSEISATAQCGVTLDSSCSFGIPPVVDEEHPDYEFFQSLDHRVYGSYGAARIALFADDVLKCVWIPNARYELSESTAMLTTQGNVEDEYLIINGPDYYTDRVAIVTADHPEGYALVDGVYYIWDLTDAPTLFEMNGSRDIV